VFCWFNNSTWSSRQPGDGLGGVVVCAGGCRGFGLMIMSLLVSKRFRWWWLV
jgi:hypothetical protein